MFVVLLFFALQKSTLAGPTMIKFLFLSFTLMIGVPVVLLLYAIKKKIVSNWDISERKERPKVFGIILVIEFAFLFLLRPIMDPFLFHTFLSIFIAMVGFAGVTLFWKISGHAFINSLVSGFIVLWFGWGFWPVLLAVPLVSWSRVVRRDHTVLQVVAGALYAWMLLILMGRF